MKRKNQLQLAILSMLASATVGTAMAGDILVYDGKQVTLNGGSYSDSSMTSPIDSNTPMGINWGEDSAYPNGPRHFVGGFGEAVTDKTVRVTGGTVAGVTAARTQEANAAGNTVILDGGVGVPDWLDNEVEIKGARVDTGDATNNEVKVNHFAGKVAAVYGADLSHYGVGANNRVVINDIDYVNDVAGAYQYLNESDKEENTKILSNNSIEFNGGTASLLTGAASEFYYDEENGSTDVAPKTQAVIGNSVTVNGGTISDAVGGMSPYNRADNNTVSINGGKITSAANASLDDPELEKENNVVIGGISNVSATGNTVNIASADAFSEGTVEVWGGHYEFDEESDGNNLPPTGDVKTGNTLNLNKVKGITLARLGNFETYNFDLPSNTVNGDTIITVTDENGTDVSHSNINVGATGAAPALHNGDKITLIRNEHGVNTTGVKYGKLQQGASLSYELTARDGGDGKSVVAVVGDGGHPSVLSQTKSLVETRAAVAGFVNNGQEVLEHAFTATDGDDKSTQIVAY